MNICIFLFAGVLPQQVFNDRQHFRLFVAEILMPSTVHLFIKWIVFFFCLFLVIIYVFQDTIVPNSCFSF